MRDLSLKTIIWHVIKYIALPLLQDKVPLTVKYLPVALLHIERFMENNEIRAFITVDWTYNLIFRQKKCWKRKNSFGILTSCKFLQLIFWKNNFHFGITSKSIYFGDNRVNSVENETTLKSFLILSWVVVSVEIFCRLLQEFFYSLRVVYIPLLSDNVNTLYLWFQINYLCHRLALTFKLHHFCK